MGYPKLHVRIRHAYFVLLASLKLAAVMWQFGRRNSAMPGV